MRVDSNTEWVLVNEVNARELNESKYDRTF